MKAGGEGRGEPASDGDGDRRGEQGLAARGGASAGTGSGRGGARAAAPAGGKAARGGERQMSGARITLPAIQHLSMSPGNDNRLKIGEKSPKPIGKGIQIQKNEN